MNRLLRSTNSAVVSDVNNWSGVSPDAQFLLIDEYGTQTNRLTLDNLKRLTGGNANLFSGNRKSYGSSYTPRRCAQLIIFSNYHLYECSGKYDPKSGKRKVTADESNILRDRFHIHRLDAQEEGDEQEEATEEMDAIDATS